MWKKERFYSVLFLSAIASKYLRLMVSRLMYWPVSSLKDSAILDHPRLSTSRKRKTIAKSTESLGLPTNILLMAIVLSLRVMVTVIL